ncbi:MAG: SagB/ThcOx family dehydrogenase, partial [Candidatus Bipolaricaulota bacterium]|nr:SagB/ThcOx family dehydrogenase [Candidatus Bipolaricaulota bacterium]
MDTNRQYLRNPAREALMAHTPDQQRGITPPPFEKPAAPGAKLIPLVPVDQITLGRMPLVNAIRDRESRREFADEALSLEELSFLLWATQGIRRVSPKGTWAMRNVPSGGCRHPFETYLRVRHVETLAPGLYRYLPVEHALVAVDAPGADPKDSL